MKSVGFRNSVRSATLVSLAAISLLVTACGGGSNSTSGDKTVNLGVASVVQKWDPHEVDWGTFLQPLQAAYDTLIRKNTDGTFGPALATSWEFTTPTTFRITLRDGVVFSDGSKLDAAAVKANFDSAAQQLGPKTPLIADWTSTTIIDDKTIEIKTNSPDPSLPLVLSQNQGMMVSPKALADHAALDQVPVGAGPYTLDTKNTLANDHYTFLKNPTYWDAKDVGFTKIVFKVYTDATAQFNALQSGQIDAMAGSSDNAKAADSLGFADEKYLSFFMGLSLQGQTGDLVPVLKDQRVRQAMEYAVDRNELQLAIGDGQPTTQIFPPGTEGYDKALDDKYPYDVDKAKQLLTAAGYPNGVDITVTTTNVAFFSKYAQVLQAQLAKANIRLTLNNVQLSDYFANRNSPNNPVYEWYYNPVNAYYDGKSILMPDGGFNPFHITDDTMVSLFNQAAGITDTAARTKVYQQLSAQFVDQAYHLITNFGDAYYFYNTKKIATWKPTLLEAYPFIYDLKPAK